MIRVLIESPFAANEGYTQEENMKYARKCCNDCLLKNEAPYASHLFYTQEGLLNDDIPHERELGINAGLLWGEVSEKSVVYVDHGVSQGMKYGIEAAIRNGRPIEVRTLQNNTTKVSEVEKYISVLGDKISQNAEMSHASTEKSGKLDIE